MKMRLFFLPFLIIILIHLHQSMATSLKVNTNNNKACGEDCLIGNYDMDAEFSLDSHAAARMLVDLSQTQTGRTSNSNAGSVNCPQSTGYRSCTPSSNGGTIRRCRSEFDRTC
ncbi:hypothetical protein RIF29_19234 [Crotalaria pallida]|uniref:Rapid ALkalinization Factor n=1 Tax=Crotalaria pallida TaxID=3830 RepID=A0AAN9F1E1_CROPI